MSLAAFNYFVFAGKGLALWDPTLYARLAYEGFFTITTSWSNQKHGPVRFFFSRPPAVLTRFGWRPRQQQPIASDS